MTAEIHDMVAAGDKAAFGAACRGTGKGGFIPGMPAAGKTFAMDAICLVRISEQGQIADHREVADTIGTVGQPGPLPAQREQGYNVVLCRQPASIIDGRPEGSYAGVFEVVCRDCGDDPGLDYRQVSPKLQLIHRPYPIVSRTLSFAQ